MATGAFGQGLLVNMTVCSIKWFILFILFKVNVKLRGDFFVSENSIPKRTYFFRFLLLLLNMIQKVEKRSNGISTLRQGRTEITRYY